VAAVLMLRSPGTREGAAPPPAGTPASR